MADSTDPLTRAIELSLEFAETKTQRDVDTFLREHEPLREILEPLIRESTDDGTDPDQRHVLGDFELVRELGRGGMGVVYEAIQTLLGRTVALKLLPPHRALSPRSLAMFRREATLAASLHHPGIARVLEFQEIDGQLALAMELVDGLPLDDVLEPLEDRSPTTLSAKDLAQAAGVAGPTSRTATAGTRTATRGTTRADSKTGTGTKAGTKTATRTALRTRTPDGWRDSYEATAVELARQVAEALAHAHSRGVVHRDVKPGNILITPEGNAVLTDFGLAREEGMVGMTRTGEFAGTYHYAAPEQLEGRMDAIDGRTDVYALGATLYEMLTLRRPIEAESLAEMLRRIQREDPAPPSRLNPRIERDLDAVVLCALEKDPARRYDTAEELANDLAHVLEGTPVKARRLSHSALVTRWIRRNQLVTAFVALLVVSTIAITLFAASAARAEQNASAQLRRYENIWVGAALDAVIARADRAHPPWPENAAELAELQRICEEELLGMREEQQAALAALRKDATQDGPAERSTTRPPHPASARIRELRATIRRLTVEAGAARVSDGAKAAAEAEIEAMEKEIAALTRIVDDSDRVRIDDAKQSALNDRIEHQLYSLRELEQTLLPDLRFRREWADTIRRRSIQDHAAAWRDVVKRLAADDRFAGHEVVPQIGLVPLGRDPVTMLEEFAHPLSGAPPARTEDGELAFVPNHGIVFVLMPGGEFERPARGRSVPAFSITLDPFFVAKHEMSRAQWIRLARDLPGLRWRDGGIADVRNHGQLEKPVNGISWDMCDRLLRRCGLELPTVTQWEYVAMFGGSVSPAELGKYANLRDQAYARARGSNPPSLRIDDGYAGLAPITSMQPTPAGVHHTLGNVSEWCRDVFLGLGTPPRGGDGLREQETPEHALRMICGGHWQSTTPMLLFDRRSSSSAARSVGVRPIRRLVQGGGK